MEGPLYVDRIIRGGDWENCGDDYLAVDFRTDLASNMRTDMGFRCFRSCRVSAYVAPRGVKFSCATPQ